MILITASHVVVTESPGGGNGMVKGQERKWNDHGLNIEIYVKIKGFS